MNSIELVEQFRKFLSSKPETLELAHVRNLISSIDTTVWKIKDASVSEASRDFRAVLVARRDALEGEARATAAELDVLFAALITAPDFSHVTSGHQVSPNSFHVYRCDTTSPTNCVLAYSFRKSARLAQMLAASRRNTVIGGQRGNM